MWSCLHLFSLLYLFRFIIIWKCNKFGIVDQTWELLLFIKNIYTSLILNILNLNISDSRGGETMNWGQYFNFYFGENHELRAFFVKTTLQKLSHCYNQFNAWWMFRIIDYVILLIYSKGLRMHLIIIA